MTVDEIKNDNYLRRAAMGSLYFCTSHETDNTVNFPVSWIVDCMVQMLNGVSPNDNWQFP